MDIIKDIRPDFMYYKDGYPEKNMIVLHTTTGYSAAGSRDWLRTATGRQLRTDKPYCTGVHYFVDRDGRILNDIPESGWAYHSSSGPHNDKRSISIEIANLTVFRKVGNNFIDIYGNVVNTHYYPIYDNESEWRGYRYFEEFPKAQVDAIVELINDILIRNPSIPKFIPTLEQFFPNAQLPYQSQGVVQGVVCHTHFVGPPGKQDMPKSFKPHYNRLVSECGLVPREIY